MAYGRKRYPARKGKGGKGIKRLLTKPTTAITTLAKAVRTIQSKMKAKTVTLNYGENVSNALLSSQLDVFPLTNYSDWNGIFGASADDTTANSMIHKGFGIDMYFDAGSETDQINFTVFLVSLKDNIRGGAFNRVTGALSLSDSVDYYTYQGFAMLNKKCFNIHACKRFTLGNNGVGVGSSTAQTQYGTDRRFYMKKRVNQKITNNDSNGNWKSLECSQDASDNYYLLVFNDNNLLDAGYPRLRYNIVHTVEQLA